MTAEFIVGLGLPVDASSEGWRIDSLLHFALIATTALGLVVLVWLAIVLIRDRRHKAARFTHGTSSRERAVPMALAALVLFAIDGYLLYRSHRDLHSSILAVDDVLASKEHLRVQIGARQWAWEFRYPGVDDRFDTEDDIYTLSHLVVPVDVAVVYELGALDVVHSLYLPNFRVKQDAIPGRVGRGWFGTRTMGRFEIACAQHCGVHHYQMSGVIEVLSAEDFATWSRDMSADAARLFAENERARRDGDDLPSETWAQASPTTDRARNWAWAWQERR